MAEATGLKTQFIKRKHSQKMPYCQIDDADMSDLADEISSSDDNELAPAHLDVLDAIEALKAPAEEPAPVVAEFVSEQWTLEPVTASLNDLDEALADIDLDTPNTDMPDLDGPDLVAAPSTRITPTLRAIMKKKRDEILADNLRNGRKAQAKKKRQREEYADHIEATEGREVREYKKNPTPERIREQDRERKREQRARRTPAQIAAETQIRSAPNAAADPLPSDRNLARASDPACQCSTDSWRY